VGDAPKEVVRAGIRKDYWMEIRDDLRNVLNNEISPIRQGKWQCKPVPIRWDHGQRICVLFWAIETKGYCVGVDDVLREWMRMKKEDISNLYEAVCNDQAGLLVDKNQSSRRALGVWFSGGKR
jgi:hypothetical protein